MGITYEIHGKGETYDSHERPEVGEFWVFEENGKWYRREIVKVHSRGFVWDQVEALDVEYYTQELNPTDYVIEKKYGKYGIITGNGEVLVPHEYDFIAKTDKKLYFKVRKDGRWGILNCLNGKAMIPVECLDILFNIYWFVRKDDWDWQCYDIDFKPTKPDDHYFRFVRELGNGLLVYDMYSEGTQGVFDSENKMLLPPVYTRIEPFGDKGLIYAYDKQTTEDATKRKAIHYIFDAEGRELCGWDWMGPLKDGLAKVCNAFFKVKYGYIDSKADIVIYPTFDELSDFDENGCASAQIGYRAKFIVHRSGKIEIDASLLGSRQCTNYLHSQQYKGISVLREVDIPDYIKLDSGTYGVFEDCKNLHSARISNCENHRYISKGMFLNCESLVNVEIPDSVTTICENAFCKCKSLAHIELPPKLEAIESGAFAGCELLETITIPASVTKIKYGGGLALCKNLKEIIVDPANKRFVSYDGVLFDKVEGKLVAYPLNREAKDFTIPSILQALYGHTFSQCRNLEKIVIPACISRIEKYAISNCMQLKEIEVSPLSNYYASFDGVLYDKEGEKLLLYPINKEAKEFVVPDTIHMLDRYTFNMNKHLEKVVIPNSVTVFGENVFYSCDGLKEVVMPDDIQHVAGEIFFLHYDMLKNLSIVISRQMYENIRKYLPQKEVRIVFKD